MENSKRVRCPQCGESRHIRLWAVHVSFEPIGGTGSQVSETPVQTQAALFACGHIVDNLSTLVAAAQAELQAEYDKQMAESNTARGRAQAETVARERAAQEEADRRARAEREAMERKNREAEQRAQDPARIAADEAENARRQAEAQAAEKRIRERTRFVFDPSEGLVTDN